MALKSSISIWKDIEKLDCKEQKRLLQWQLQAREPIHRFSDMKVGDHLVRKGSFIGGLLSYEHHFICTGFDCEEKPKIVHYYNTALNAVQQLFPTGLISGSALEQLGIVQEMTLPHEGFIKREEDLQAEGEEVERVVWPEELRRYTVEEVIDRALGQARLGENFFHPTQNNCESFVMWCMCDLNISLQVTQKLKTLCETGSASIRSFWHSLQQLLKVGAELVDDVAVAIGRRVGQAAPKALPKVGVCVGAAVTVLVEAMMAAYDIYNSYKKWNDGALISSRREFIKEVVDAVLLGMFRSGGSIAGMVVGQIVIPIPVLGGLVGAVLGVFGGHLLGKVTAEKKSERLAQLIDSAIKKIEKD